MSLLIHLLPLVSGVVVVVFVVVVYVVEDVALQKQTVVGFAMGYFVLFRFFDDGLSFVIVVVAVVDLEDGNVVCCHGEMDEEINAYLEVAFHPPIHFRLSDCVYEDDAV